ncbi:Crp/Fnr family transcriptional regulator [Nostoc sp. T09]|uniref:Crp/Fnr family transcriptional regulator n=1 Tax=Nostoc sp. T09 TaxID=1932621 RepID=UPI00211B3FF1|nr:Crp/Fnr family transcriptional regulator [Nostoc sp. T09]
MENRLLAALSPEEYSRIVAYMELVPLEFKQDVYLYNQPIEYVYFPKHGVISLLTIMADGSAVEVATVGNEGMVGLPILLGANSIPGQAFSQVPGDAWRMSADAFKAHVTPSSPLHDLLQRYTQALFNQIAQSAACNRLHSIEERFCRWLLMTADRVERDSFPLTQEFLAQMLGVNRSSVSLTASILQRAGLIEYVRGQMTIVDRDSLEATSCECYQIVKVEFERLLNGNSSH